MNDTLKVTVDVDAPPEFSAVTRYSTGTVEALGVPEIAHDAGLKDESTEMVKPTGSAGEI